MTALLAKRLVVKVGSALLVDEAAGRPRTDWLAALAEDIAALRRSGTEVIAVSSGAIALGRVRLPSLPPKPRMRLEEKQAAAAAGQLSLARAWEEALGAHGLPAAQILLTLDDSEERRRYLNARATLETLLALGAVPVINENDTVATSEIRFGDNDRLAARVAEMVAADLLVLLSDIDGLYTADPRRDISARHIAEVDAITPEIEAMAGDAVPGMSSGGMVTKLAAAKIATGAGCRMVIAHGGALHALAAVMEGRSRRTLFAATAAPRSAWKSWIAGALKPAGRLLIDAGAARALRCGRSLLPAGVCGVEGEFARGDCVEVVADGVAVARGLANYAAEDARRIAGRHSREIERILGFAGREEMIHRDDLALL
ncbi:glutamate 5-kinase [Elioraea tepida]|jgi:glutamate 5-kinase|uniref:Glutamate 5-kinase n=1 Tax=Elioraea tepida TaxID=2843330 RepID=A0A975YK53_9PROT|nr:glutamate 5-kinase [Elioraea tepida]QXM25435.1 glutamate 5-kinase [Elioraea tepida]